MKKCCEGLREGSKMSVYVAKHREFTGTVFIYLWYDMARDQPPALKTDSEPLSSPAGKILV